MILASRKSTGLRLERDVLHLKQTDIKSFS
jgi:hypothetical protein